VGAEPAVAVILMLSTDPVDGRMFLSCFLFEHVGVSERVSSCCFSVTDLQCILDLSAQTPTHCDLPSLHIVYYRACYTL